MLVLQWFTPKKHQNPHCFSPWVHCFSVQPRWRPIPATCHSIHHLGSVALCTGRERACRRHGQSCRCSSDYRWLADRQTGNTWNKALKHVENNGLWLCVMYNLPCWRILFIYRAVVWLKEVARSPKPHRMYICHMRLGPLGNAPPMVFVGCDRNLSGTKEFFVGYKLCPDGSWWPGFQTAFGEDFRAKEGSWCEVMRGESAKAGSREGESLHRANMC